MRPHNFENFLWIFKKNLEFHPKQSFNTYLNFIHKSFSCNYRKTINEKEVKILRSEWKKFREYVSKG